MCEHYGKLCLVGSIGDHEIRELQVSIRFQRVLAQLLLEIRSKYIGDGQMS